MPSVADLYELIYYPGGSNADPELPAWLHQLLSKRTPGADLLDVACGTGHPTLLLGDVYNLTLADKDRSMIQRARRNARLSGVAVCRFLHARWEELSSASLGKFDVIICAGNALAQCSDAAAIEASLRTWASLLRPEGLLYVDVREFPTGRFRRNELLELYGPVHWQRHAYLVIARERRLGNRLYRTKVLHPISGRGVGAATAIYRTDYFMPTKTVLLRSLETCGYKDVQEVRRPGKWVFNAYTAVRRNDGLSP